MKRKTRQSLGWWLGVILLVGQAVPILRGDVPAGIYPILFLVGTLVLVLVPIFGSDFFLALVREVRGRSNVNADDAGQNESG